MKLATVFYGFSIERQDNVPDLKSCSVGRSFRKDIGKDDAPLRCQPQPCYKGGCEGLGRGSDVAPPDSTGVSNLLKDVFDNTAGSGKPNAFTPA